MNLEVSDAGQTGRMDEQEEHQDKGASSGGAHADDAVDIPEGRWKLLKDLPQLELTGAQTWEQGVQLASWRAQCSTIFNGVGYSFAQYAKLVWSQAEKMYSDKTIGMKKPAFVYSRKPLRRLPCCVWEFFPGCSPQARKRRHPCCPF